MPAIIGSTISDTLKTEFKDGKRYGKIRGLTLLMDSKKNIEFVKELIFLKLKYFFVKNALNHSINPNAVKQPRK